LGSSVTAVKNQLAVNWPDTAPHAAWAWAVVMREVYDRLRVSWPLPAMS